METKVCKYCGQEKPIEEFLRNRYGYTSVCKECQSRNLKTAMRVYQAAEKDEETGKRTRVSKQMRRISELEKEIESARFKRLNDFTPREMMLELKRRGYDGTLKYVEEHYIDLGKLE